MSNEIELLIVQKDNALDQIKYLGDAIKIVQALANNKKIIDRNCLLVYFPKNGCFSCLEDILTKKLPSGIMNNEVIVYSDFDKINKMIFNINDSYRTQFESYFGKALLEGRPDEIYVFVYNENDTFSVLKKDSTGQYFKK
ncbi:MAG: hypothetical protein U9N54_09305 [candidate division Zixibacteria bacterium]|nr:hypothetical protein [candidate division Zixibacteria bacterium]